MPDGTGDGSPEELRIDKWLWSVRLYRTRSLSTGACRAGHVALNGADAKASAQVRVGDRVRARVGDRDRVVEVVRLIDKRVGAPVAAECYVDHSPPVQPLQPVAPVFRREPGAGRPTKRDRRAMDRFRGR